MLRKNKDRAKTILERRKRRNRFKLKKSLGNKPRLSVFMSNLHIYAQIIDDIKGITIASASTVDKELKSKLKQTSNKDAASSVGQLVATRAQSLGVVDVVFDRGSHLYHGKVKMLADSAREAGLKF